MRLHKHFYVAIAMLAASSVLGMVYFNSLVSAGINELIPLSQPLSTIPTDLGDWHGLDETMRGDVLLKIGAEDYLKRTYRRGQSEVLKLYIAYFGGIRGMAPHSPDICRPGGGFKNISSEVVTIRVPGFGDESLRVHKDLYERDFEKEVVVWWEYVHGKNVASRTLQRMQWALPKSLGGKVGSILQVQISMAFKGSMEECMNVIEDFMNLLGPHIKAVLPGSENDRPQAEERQAEG